MLSIHVRRSDGFHELTSLMVALKFGDTLMVRISDSGEDSLTCSDPAVPVGSENLVLKAAYAFRARLKQAVYFDFQLEKRIPMGAGLGGGSGNAVAALSGMNQLLGSPLDEKTLRELSADLGSDCPFFVGAKPAWIHGRGEHVKALDAALCDRLRGVPLILFKPNFGVDTAWAYERLVANAPESYNCGPVDTIALEELIQAGALDGLLHNSFEAPVGKKYLAIPALLNQLRAEGVVCMMSGSGSACFALPEDRAASVEHIKERVVDAWGEEVFYVETSIS